MAEEAVQVNTRAHAMRLIAGVVTSTVNLTYPAVAPAASLTDTVRHQHDVYHAAIEQNLQPGSAASLLPAMPLHDSVYMQDLYLVLGASIVAFLLALIFAIAMLRSRQSMKYSNELLEKISTQIPGAIFKYVLRSDGSSYYAYASKGIKDIYGLRPDQISIDGDKVGLLIHDSDLERVKSAIRESAENLTLWRQEFRVYHPTHDEIWVEVTATPERQTGGVTAWYGYIRDITETRRQSQALRDRERHYRDILETSPDWLWEIDKGGFYTYASGNVFDLLGYTPDEVIGKTPFDLMPEDEAERVSSIVDEILRYRSSFHGLEHYNLHKQGHLVILESSGVPIFDDNDDLCGYRGINRDITERKRTEAALLEQRTFLNTILDTEPDCVVVMDGSGHSLQMNKSGLELFEVLDLSDINEIGIDRFIQEDYRDRFIQARNSALQGSHTSLEACMRSSSGTLRWLNIHTAPLANPSGQITSVLASTRDITGQKHALDALRESESRFRNLFENSPVAYFALDAACIIVDYNPKFVETLGYHGDDLVGHSLTEFWLETSPSPSNSPNPNVRREYFSNEFVLRRRDGVVITTLIEGRVQRDSQGHPLITHCILHDITQRKNVEEAMARARAIAESANQAKTNFLASMSHELRTPLNSIIGFSQILDLELKGSLRPSHQEALSHIISSSQHLHNLVNDVLDLARIDAGRLDLAMGDVDLTPLLEECLNLIKPSASTRSINISSSLCDNFMVHADSTRLRQVLLNLLSNAVKYNQHKGAIELSCTTIGDRVRISISDTGPGIALEQQANIFQPFHRLGAERTTIEGTGIGLIIAKRLIEAMGGQIDFTSKPGSGTTFWVELPRKKPKPAHTGEAPHKPSAAPITSIAHRTVLYVEDHPANINVMRHVFRHLPGVELSLAENGVDGITKAQESPPDLVLLDINLPDMDGYAVLRALKANSGTAHVPVIAVTAVAMQKDIDKGLRQGFTAYITKPFDVSKFIRLIRSTLEQGDS